MPKLRRRVGVGEPSKDRKSGKDMPEIERGRDVLRILDRTIGIPAVAVLSTLRRRRHFSMEASTIGLIALGAIGDTILSVGAAIPVLRQSFPRARLHLFTSKSNSGVAPLLSPVDGVHVISVTNPISAISLLRSIKQDILIDFSPWPRISAVLAALADAGFTIGFNTSGQYRHYAYDLSVKHSSKIHEFENHANLLDAIGVRRPATPVITPSASAFKRVHDENTNPYVVCHPWASGYRSEMREWPVESWRELADTIARQGWDVVFTGGPMDAARSKALVEGCAAGANKIRGVAGHYSLDETAALVESSACLVTVNTGILHLAAAVHARIVALHGPTNPVRWGPLSDDAVIIRPDAPDVAYLNLGFEYPKQAKSNMHLIGVDQVATATLQQLKRYKGAQFDGRSGL
jgi:heptosyltransferase III